MKEIEKMPSTHPATVYSLKEKKSYSKQWKYTIAAACLCAIIATGTIISIPTQNDISESGTTGDPYNTSYISPSVQTNSIHWNEGPIMNNSRLAGEFHTVTENEWKAYFNTDLPAEGKINYFLVYEISKENGVTDNVMCGYISVELSNDTSYSAYVSKGTLKLSPVLVDISTFKEQQLKIRVFSWVLKTTKSIGLPLSRTVTATLLQ